MFQFVDPTDVKLRHINVRTERHGPADIDACDLDMEITGENRVILGLLNPALCATLYHSKAEDNGQESVEGAPPSLPNLRFPRLPPTIGWKDEATGVDLKVIYGTGDERSNIALENGKATVKSFECEEGGSVTLTFKYSVAGYPDGVIDKLRKKLNQLITITMVRPEKLRADAIDGTVGHPGLAARRAAEAAEAAGQQRLDVDGDAGEGDPDEHDQDGVDGGARPKDATEAFLQANRADAAEEGAAS